jgi:hypothetical protein
MTLGGVYDTQDAWGKIEKNRCHSLLQRRAVVNPGRVHRHESSRFRDVFSGFITRAGASTNLARQAWKWKRSPREVKITSLQMRSQHIDGEGNPVIELEITCSKGPMFAPFVMISANAWGLAPICPG